MSGKNKPKIAIVIASWNGWKHLEICLPALRSQTFRDFFVVLVDNGSSDGTDEFVKTNYPEVKFISLPKNTGFAYAYNLGIKKAFEDPGVKYVVTLNNDTKPEPAYLGELMKAAERYPDAATIQPKVVNFYDRNVIDSVGILVSRDMSAINRGQKEKDRGQYEKEEEIFGASASAALYRRDALEAVKLTEGEYFDNSYFAYYEDVDLAWRLRLAGYSAIYAPKAVVYHVHSATGKNFSPFKAFHIHRNQYYNIIKNLPFPFCIGALLRLPVRYFLLGLSIFRKKGPSAELSKQSGRVGAAGIVLHSWRDVIVNLPTLLKKRRMIQNQRKATNKEIEKWFREYKADTGKMIFG